MEVLNITKEHLGHIVGLIGAIIATPLGGYDMLLEALLLLILLDIIAGVVRAALFNSSKYSNNGLTSSALFKGALRKIMILIIIAVCVVIDRILGISYVRNYSILYFIATEGLSLLEHMVIMGVPFPAFVKDILDVILEKANSGNNGENPRENEADKNE